MGLVHFLDEIQKSFLRKNEGLWFWQSRQSIFCERLQWLSFRLLRVE
jgi:hypothetical protein